MPMTEQLKQSLSDPYGDVQVIADLLKKDGLNCRDSLSMDTPLILATRHGNEAAIAYMLSTLEYSPDKTEIINAVNNNHQSALIVALQEANDKRAALSLLKNGAEPDAMQSSHLSYENQRWLQPFFDYTQHDDDETRAASAFQIANYYTELLNDDIEATKWLEFSAHHGNKFAMLQIAKQYYSSGDTHNAMSWYKRCIHLLTDSEQDIQDEMIANLQSIAQQDQVDIESASTATTTLGCMYAQKGDITTALLYFNHAEQMTYNSPQAHHMNELFFRACCAWFGPDPEKNISSLDYLDCAKRISWLLDAHTEEADLLLHALATTNYSRIFQLIACQLGKDHGKFNAAQTAVLSKPENQTLMQALSFLYGWNGQPKNIMRAAGLLKKLDTNSFDQDTTYIVNTLIAFVYLQQQAERELYVCEALNLLNCAHEILEDSDSPHRRGILLTLADEELYA